MIGFKQNQKVIYKDKEMTIIGFMNDDRICLEFNGFYHYVYRDEIKVI